MSRRPFPAFLAELVAEHPHRSRNAGAEVVDEEVVVDGQLLASRSPDDLPAFCPAIVEHFSRVPAGVR